MSKWLILLCLVLLYSCKTEELQKGEWRVALCKDTRGALVGTRFSSLEDLKECLDIEYRENKTVIVKHHSNGQVISSVLKNGITEKDLERVQVGKLSDKIKVAARMPYLIFCRNDLKRIMLLARRMGAEFGEGDKGFYDLAQTMIYNINKSSSNSEFRDDYSEKGLLNTFNHLTAQAFITTLFSEKTADLVADLHELARLPELTSGKFSKQQLADLSNGPVDNYVDLINNEWGQNLGNILKTKYKISRNTEWTPALLQAYLNDIQSYCAWATGLNFLPFTEDDQIVMKFANKLNQVLNETHIY